MYIMCDMYDIYPWPRGQLCPTRLVGAGHRVSRPRGTGSVGDSVGEGTGDVYTGDILESGTQYDMIHMIVIHSIMCKVCSNPLQFECSNPLQFECSLPLQFDCRRPLQ